jgi:hypothetical protein
VKRTGLIYLGVLLLFVGLIVWRVARDEADEGDRAALFLERCRLEAPEADCQAALSQRGLTCQATWYGAEPPASDRWSGYYTCVRGPAHPASH